jgi:hypothetical protein
MSQFADRPDKRLPLLTAERNQKMTVSAHAYVRGNTGSSMNGWKLHNAPMCPKDRRFGFAAIATLAI